MFKKISDKLHRERKILIYLVPLCLVFALLLINIFYDSDVQFLICFIILIILTCNIESLASNLLAKVVPNDWELGTINAGFLITISTTSGRVVGSCMLTIGGAISTNYINSITFGFISVLFAIGTILTIIFYGELRVKAIVRIMKSAINKI